MDENRRFNGPTQGDIVMPEVYQSNEKNVPLEETKGAAIKVLHQNTEADGARLPRTAGFGYRGSGTLSPIPETGCTPLLAFSSVPTRSL